MVLYNVLRKKLIRSKFSEWKQLSRAQHPYFSLKEVQLNTIYRNKQLGLHNWKQEIVTFTEHIILEYGGM